MSPWFMPAMERRIDFLSPTFASGNTHRSFPSQRSTPISSCGPSASRTPMAQSRAIWLPFMNSMPCMISATAPGGRTFFLLGGYDQYPRIAANRREIDRAIVLRDGIARRLDLHFVAVKSFFSQRLREGEQVFAGFQLDRLFAEQLVVQKEANGCALRLV